ncbi:ergothioneine biosynthesis glutamate--cysteine ligase EgtA [Microbispora sp. NEAU-D428]|uniref:ergothioneine biosynthesis glutamate--cysteine ligase EgtA n=1 Tax=Microbispora sitophila TaxID=2771537 RepID=UPI00186901B5|nr:ergothioneine biosynthesis glutamate--cysteine ligase EgtA [Microbispora sitophila]MBE3008025.1 ergothioneine biosynthesis glutamate--cysteine ligase EgtA [Microbispora sitophila]
MTDVHRYARDCFRGVTSDRLGVELEFLVFDADNPALPVPIARIAGALPALPGGSRVTFEPGGQLELSAPPDVLPAAIAKLTADVDAVRLALARAGLRLGGRGLDALRPPLRQLREPRYEAMAAFLDWPDGLTMMCSTASVQVNLDFGEDSRTRWERSHILGPVLVAAFANSPAGGWASGRQAVWSRLDPSRTAPVARNGDPVDDWARYLLDARLMLVRGDGGLLPVLDGSPFRDFARVAGRPPGEADLAYHATTLFPPVRPRGWLEVRYLDAQGAAEWPVCVAVVHALVTDDRAAGAAMEAARPVAHRWADAARLGLADPDLRRSASACFAAAAEALPRLGAEPSLVARVRAFSSRHIESGRSPAADQMEEMFA